MALETAILALIATAVRVVNGTYAIVGGITIPTGRNIECQPGQALTILMPLARAFSRLVGPRPAGITA